MFHLRLLEVEEVEIPGFDGIVTAEVTAPFEPTGVVPVAPAGPSGPAGHTGRQAGRTTGGAGLLSTK